MVWTYCSACGRRTEWAASCAECGSPNPLYGPALPDQVHGDTGPAASLNATFLQSWGYLLAVLLVSSFALTVLLAFPVIFG